MLTMTTVCEECLALGDEFPAGAEHVARFGHPRRPAPEPYEGCDMCGNGGGSYLIVPTLTKYAPDRAEELRRAAIESARNA